MNIYDFVVEFQRYNLFCKNNLPNEIVRYLFSFIIFDIKKVIIYKYLDSIVDEHRIFNDLNIHFNTIPYLNSTKFLNNKNRIDVKNYLLSELNKKFYNLYVFSHYCCGGKGIKITTFNN